MLFKSRNFQNVVVGVLTASLCHVSFGLDLELNRSLEAQTKSGVSSADTVEEGKSSIAVEANRSLSLISRKQIASGYDLLDERDPSLLNKTGRATFIYQYGLLDFLELNLGLSGSYEESSDSARELIVGEFDDERKSDFSNIDFAGSSALLKIKMLDLDHFKIAMAPFVYEGLGQKAEMATTRSNKVRGGWKAIMSAENEYFGMDLNMGYRYRYIQQVGELRVRNSQFSQVALSGKLTSILSLYIQAKTDVLMVSDDAKHDFGDERKYEPLQASEFGGGIQIKAKDYHYAIYGAGSMSDTRGLGYGKSHFGVSFGMPIGKNSRGDVRVSDDGYLPKRKRTVKIADEDKKVPVMKKNPKVKKTANTVDQYSYSSGLEYSGDSDEINFDQLQNELLEPNGQPKVADIDLVEKELDELHKAEMEYEAKQEKLRKRNQEKIRKSQLAKLKNKRQKIKQVRDEIIQEGSDDLDINAEDVEWNGLD